MNINLNNVDHCDGVVLWMTYIYLSQPIYHNKTKRILAKNLATTIKDMTTLLWNNQYHTTETCLNERLLSETQTCGDRR